MEEEKIRSAVRQKCLLFFPCFYAEKIIDSQRESVHISRFFFFAGLFSPFRFVASNQENCHTGKRKFDVMFCCCAYIYISSHSFEYCLRCDPHVGNVRKSVLKQNQKNLHIIWIRNSDAEYVCADGPESIGSCARVYVCMCVCVREQKWIEYNACVESIVVQPERDRERAAQWL